MAPYLEHPKVLRVTYKQLHWNQKIGNVVHWYSDAALDQDRVEAFADAAHSTYYEVMPSMWSFQMAYRGSSYRQMIRSAPLGTDRAILGGVDGEITVNANRPAQAIALKLKTATFNKSGAGTYFGGGIPDNVVIAGFYDDNYATNYATALNNYFLAVKAAQTGWRPVIYSQQAGGAQRSQVTLYPITGVECVTLYPAHISSRNPGQGD